MIDEKIAKATTKASTCVAVSANNKTGHDAHD